jgi:hypothetical protein
VSPGVLAEVASRYAAQSSTLRTVVCISAWTITNGFDSVVNFAFEPHQPRDEHISKLKDAFWDETNRLMTDWGRAGFAIPENQAEALRPIVFETGDGRFSLVPPKLESSLERQTIDE